MMDMTFKQAADWCTEMVDSYLGATWGIVISEHADLASTDLTISHASQMIRLEWPVGSPSVAHALWAIAAVKMSDRKVANDLVSSQTASETMRLVTENMVPRSPQDEQAVVLSDKELGTLIDGLSIILSGDAGTPNPSELAYYQELNSRLLGHLARREKQAALPKGAQIAEFDCPHCHYVGEMAAAGVRDDGLCLRCPDCDGILVLGFDLLPKVDGGRPEKVETVRRLVRFLVHYDTEIEVPLGADYDGMLDACREILVPQDKDTRYVQGTFHVLRIGDAPHVA